MLLIIVIFCSPAQLLMTGRNLERHCNLVEALGRLIEGLLLSDLWHSGSIVLEQVGKDVVVCV